MNDAYNNDRPLNVTMIGSGYVGLVSGVCFAECGHSVTCVDIDDMKVANLKKGIIPIYEPGLDRLVVENMNAKRLGFTTDLDTAVANSNVVFIAVGTPTRDHDGAADLSYVYAAAEQIGRAMTGFTVVVTKSTVPVGTGDEVEKIIRNVNPEAEFAVVSNPEFLREGAAIADFMNPDRIVIGYEDDRARPVMERLYSTFSQFPIQYTGRRTAELIKYAGNAFLAMKITFINEMATLCEKAGGDILDVARGIGLDSRIGNKFLNPGPGYGGSCFPKDTLALAKTGRDFGAPIELVEATIRVNEERKRNMAFKAIEAFGGDVRGKTIGILGLTFKPDTDDMRDAPSLAIVAALQKEGAKIKAYDPQGMKSASRMMQGVEFSADAYDAVENTDGFILVTEWAEFKDVDLSRMAESMVVPTVVDLRNMFDADKVASNGMAYTCIGRPNVESDAVPVRAVYVA